MREERLEEIVKQVKRSDEYAEKGLWTASDKKIVNLHNEGHINYLIERVQELEEDNKNLQVLSSINRKEYMRIHEQNKCYREAISYVMGAKSSHYDNNLDHALDDIKFTINETLKGRD